MTSKRIFLFLVIIIGMGVIASAHAQTQMKFGYIDTQKILATYPKALDAQKKLEEERGVILQDLQRQEDEIRTAQQTLEQQSLLLSEEKKREKAQEIQNMVVKLQEETQRKDQQFAQRRDEILQPVYDDINVAIRNIREAEDYDFILDAMNLLDAKKEYDLTDKVLTNLGVDVTSQNTDKQ